MDGYAAGVLGQMVIRFYVRVLRRASYCRAGQTMDIDKIITWSLAIAASWIAYKSYTSNAKKTDVDSLRGIIAELRASITANELDCNAKIANLQKRLIELGDDNKLQRNKRQESEKNEAALLLYTAKIKRQVRREAPEIVLPDYEYPNGTTPV